MTSLKETGAEAPTHTRFYLAAWRWHFYAGLYVVPFLATLAITGLAMMYISLIDGRDGENIQVAAKGDPVPISRQAEAALSVFGPEAKLAEWIGARDANHTNLVRIQEDGTHHFVAIDPYSGDVLSTWVRRDGWYDFFNDIHGTLLIGTTGDRLIEIAAGLALVLIVTGLYLWWPRAGSGKAFSPEFTTRGRAFWKSLHRVIGAYTAPLLVLFLLSGLSWAGIWGEKFVQAWNTFPAEKWAEVPLSDETHASMNHGAVKDVPWGLEQTQLPASGSSAGQDGLAPGVPVTIDTVAGFARDIGFDGRFHINLPRSAAGVWTLSRDTMSNDAENPFSDRTVHIDQYTGKILADVGFADYSAGARAMAVGIAFHEGDMGLWNVVLNTLLCLSVLFLCISGVVMWWLRRPKGAFFRVFAPKTPEDLPHWRGAMFLMLVLSLAFPLVGLTLITAMAVDLLIVQRIPMLRKALA